MRLLHCLEACASEIDASDSSALAISRKARAPHLDGNQHLVAIRAEVGALGQVDFSKCPLAELPLQHNVLPLDVLDA